MRRINNIPGICTGRYFLILSAIASVYMFKPAFGADQSKIDTLAIIGKKVITSADFIQSYKEKLAKIGLTDNGETRNKYLQNLADDELFISNAKQTGLDKTASAKNELKRLRLQELLNAFSLKHISPSVNVTESDLKKLFVKLNTKIKVSHIYAPDRGKADSLYKLLMNGKKFEDLARENFLDPMLKNNGGSLGYISVDDMDPAFEKAAYAMHPGDISKPVKTVEGYSIIRVEDIKGNPLVTENEFLKAHDRLLAFERKRAYEDASRHFAESLTTQLKVKLNNKLISKIYNVIRLDSLQALIENPSVISQNDLKKNILTSSLGNWSLQTLINELSVVTDKQKKFIRSRENLEDLIYGLVNRKYISQMAVSEKLDQDSLFKHNVEFNFDTFLLTTLENELRDKIKISPDSVKATYYNNLKQYTTAPAIRISTILVDNTKLADTVKLALQKGEQFEALAKKYSIQSFTAASGGDMGFFKKEDLGNLADQIFALAPGQFAGPFADDNKFAFIKCTDFKKPAVKPFDEVSADIEHNLAYFQWLSLKEKYAESFKQNISYKLFTQKLYELKL